MNETREAPTSGFVDGCIARMLERAGLAPRQRVNYVAQTLQLGYQLARRRIIGETPWTIDEIARLASSCGESLSSLFVDDSAFDSVGTDQDAEFVLGSVRIPCRVWIGAKATSRQLSPLVALQPAKDQWIVVSATDAPEGDFFQVERLLIELGEVKRHRVAVLDDDRDIANSIVDYMTATGVDAQAFFSLDELLSQIDTKAFDGYVVDWLIDTQTTRSLLAAIRAKDQTCPIVLFTGQLETGNVGESELASIASFYRLTYFEKPIRTSSIMSALQLGFKLRASA